MSDVDERVELERRLTRIETKLDDLIKYLGEVTSRQDAKLEGAYRMARVSIYIATGAFIVALSVIASLLIK